MTSLKHFSLFSVIIFSSVIFAVDERPPSLNQEERDFTATKNLNNEIVPTLPDEASDSRNIPQPEVRIIRTKDTTIEEYRVNGILRYIKITPSVGSPYYMVDTNGDGILDTRNDNFANPPVNQWIVLEW